MSNKHNGELIRMLRKSKGFTLEEVAGKNFTKGYISLIERGKVTPSLKVLNHIAEILETDVAKLLNNSSLENDIAMIEADFTLRKYKDVVLKSEKIDVCLNSPSSLKVLLLRSKAFFHLGQYDESIKDLEVILTSEDDWSQVYRFEAYFYLSRCLSEKQRYIEAIEVYDIGIEFGNRYNLEWRELIANMYLNKATVLQILKRYQDAISEYNKCLQYSKKYNILEPLLDSFIRLGFCYYASNNVYTAKQYVSKALDINVILDLKLPQADTSLLLSHIYLTEENIQLAEEHAEKSYRLYEKLLKEEEYIEALLTLADIYKRTDRVNKAKEILEKIYSEGCSITLSSSIIERIADMCVELGLSDIANVFYSRLVKKLKTPE